MQNKLIKSAFVHVICAHWRLLSGITAPLRPLRLVNAHVTGRYVRQREESPESQKQQVFTELSAQLHRHQRTSPDATRPRGRPERNQEEVVWLLHVWMRSYTRNWFSKKWLKEKIQSRILSFCNLASFAWKRCGWWEDDGDITLHVWIYLLGFSVRNLIPMKSR